MALQAVLEFGDNSIQRYSKQYLVSDCRFVFDRSYNEFRPEGAAYCDRIEVVIIAPGKTDLSLFEWFANQGEMSGRISISLSIESKFDDTDTQMLFFEDAKCFSLSECYDVDNSRRRLLRLGILAERIKIDNTTFNF